MVKSQNIVTVCDKCLTEACWRGIGQCAEARARETGLITDTEEAISKMTPSEIELAGENKPEVGLEIIGPFPDYRVTIDGYEVPDLRAVRVNGMISMTLDHRFGCDIPDDEHAHSIIWFIANVMAVAAGYSCFGENAKPANPFKCRMTGIGLSQVDDGTALCAEIEQ